MQTNFDPADLRDPHLQSSEKILRTCVHCGFCTATCPTYLLLGDELDSPRGRIYLIKDMLEGGKPATPDVVKHLDRCLSCLSCMTTCPSGVHYMHLIDHARMHIEKTYHRPAGDRLVRALLAFVLPHRGRFRLALQAARLAKPLRPLVARLPGLGPRLAAMLDLAPAALPAPGDARREEFHAPRALPAGEKVADRPDEGTAGPSNRPSSAFRASPPRREKEDMLAALGIERTVAPPRPAAAGRRRMGLLTGCAQAVLQPSINEAATRLLGRHGIEVVLPRGEGCCGALVHHMGREEAALAYARTNIDAWTREIEAGGLDAIVITASGCGTTIKDYGFMLRADPRYADKAARVSALAKDVTEVLDGLDLTPVRPTGLLVAYHSACSMQHGQRLGDLPKALLRRVGFTVRDVPEGHICCGSAGTYNILQPELAGRLRARKIANIETLEPALIATGNIGCMTQIGQGTAIPICHTVELMDWATGGPRPAALALLPDITPTPLAAE